MGLTDIPGTGLIAAAVPATVGALITALIESGTLGLEETLGPVVDLARDGFAIYPALRSSLASSHHRISHWPSTAEVFLAGGVPDVGKIVKFPAWSHAMTHLLDASVKHRAKGGSRRCRRASMSSIAGGSRRRSIDSWPGASEADAGREHPAALELADLAAHRTTIETPATFRYRGLDVFKCPPWSQGPVFLQQLALLAGDDLSRLGHNSVEYIHLVVEAAKLAFADREAFYGTRTSARCR
jgi:gamma-glutamyltranspeptidase/glutathione hydrolase